MGPLLFNIFINDIVYFVRECDLYGYADDNTLSKAAKDAASLKRALERDTANMLSWSVFCPGFQKGRVPSENGTLSR